jgi:hypothetical protein
MGIIYEFIQPSEMWVELEMPAYKVDMPKLDIPII